MKYYYFPSSYFKYMGRGFSGAGFLGANAPGFLIGCGYGGNIKEVTAISPNEIAEKANFIEQSSLAKTEANSTPALITKKRFDLWKWLGDTKQNVKDWFLNKYKTLNDLMRVRMAKMVKGAKVRSKAGKEWLKDKYDRFRNFKSSRLNRLNLWRLDKQESLKKWAKGKYEKLMNSPKMKSLCNYIKSSKMFVRDTANSAWEKVKGTMVSMGINIYAYGRATVEVLKETVMDAFKKGKEMAKDITKGGFEMTKETVLTLAQALRLLGWSPLQIAIGICAVKSTASLKDKLSYAGMDVVSKMGGKGLMRKRKGRFVKGSPEAKAYMSYLRSLRRKN